MSDRKSDSQFVTSVASSSAGAGRDPVQGFGREREDARAALLAFVDELAKCMTHDVNQPLGAILMTANACRRGLATGALSLDHVREGLERIVADVGRASATLAQFRAATRRPCAVRTPTDINAAIRLAVADAEDELAGLEIVPAIELDAELPAVLADAVQLRLVVRTLISRAVQSMAAATARKPSICVRSMRTAPHEITVEVEDSGAGVRASDVERMFDMFSSTPRGTVGLELAVARAIIEDHDGRIWTVASACGAVFRFMLPEADEH